MSLDKQPNSLPAEKAVLSSLLWNNEAIYKVIDIISPNDFFNNAHKIIYECIIKLVKENKPLTLPILQTELEDRKQLDQVGGLGYLVELQDDIPDVLLIEKHAQIIKEKTLLRELVTISLNNITYCQNIGSKSVEIVLDEAEKSLMELSKKRQVDVGHQLSFFIKKTFEEMALLNHDSSGLTGISSGFGRLDRLTYGFQKSDLIILAARPAMGKTSLVMNIAVNAAHLGYSIGVISLEMAATQLVTRILATESNIDQYKIRQRKCDESEAVSLVAASKKLSELKIVLEDRGALNIMNIRSIARSFKFTHKIDLLIIDYLQLINSLKRNDGRVNEISEISRSLKALAKELDIPIICLSQLSRDCEKRDDKRPQLSDLRDSGAIEQDADIVLFIYRDVVYNKDAEPNEAELIIAKHRNGSTGIVRLGFEPRLTKFYED